MQYVGKTWRHQELNSTIRIDKKQRNKQTNKQTNKQYKSCGKTHPCTSVWTDCKSPVRFWKRARVTAFWGVRTQRQQIYENRTKRKAGVIWVFPKIVVSLKWMVYNGKSHLNGWFGGKTHHFRKPPFENCYNLIQINYLQRRHSGVWWTVIIGHL